MAGDPGRARRSVDEHLAAVLASVRALPSEECAPELSVGRVLAEPVVAALDLPPWDAAAMDGFAVHHADVVAADAVPVVLAVVADVAAGSTLDPAVPRGAAARVMTGAPVPSDADTVVPVEHTADGFAGPEGAVTVVRAPRAAGAHVRRRGEDVAVGHLLHPAGAVLAPADAARARAAGVSTVRVARRPRVAVISTGDELRMPSEPLGRGGIPESNSVLLAGLARAAGADAVTAVVPDDVAVLRSVLAGPAMADCDLMVTSGGISAGVYEVVRIAFGADPGVGFFSVDMRPGRPQAAGVLADGRVLLGLPGTPGGAHLSFELFVRPVLARMQGRADAPSPRLVLPVTDGWRGSPGPRRYVPVAIDRSDPRQWYASPTRAGAGDGWAIVPEHTGEVAAGDRLEVLIARW